MGPSADSDLYLALVDSWGLTPPGWVAKYSLLGVTALGTMSNNIINVPLNRIAVDFDRPVSAAVLTVSAFVLVLAVAMPLTGWVGDRLGRRRTLVAALVLMLTAQLAAASAPTLEFLIGTRAVQGLACSAIPPMVMGMLVTLYPERRFRMMSAWAAANGIGQAIGPPIGGLVSALAGWRSIFVVMAVASGVVLLGLLRSVPGDRGRPSAMHLPGALMLTSGTALALVALTVISQPHIPLAVTATAGVVGMVLMSGFVLVSRGNPRAMIPPHLIVETRFLRSSIAAFSQMFALGTLLVVIPLYFTETLGIRQAEAGALFFVLPLSMAVMALAIGRLVDHVSPRLVLRSGLGLLVVALVVAGLVATDSYSTGHVVIFSLLLVLFGLGVAMVQTPAAGGATRSPAGQTGAALGLFNMLRFSGSTAGTAWVALAYTTGELLPVFVGAAVVVLVGLVATFAGSNPPGDVTPGAPSTD